MRKIYCDYCNKRIYKTEDYWYDEKEDKSFYYYVTENTNSDDIHLDVCRKCFLKFLKKAIEEDK